MDDLANWILLESATGQRGDSILLEDGFHLLLERDAVPGPSNFTYNLQVSLFNSVTDINV